MFDYRSSNTFNYFSDLNPERRALIDALQAEIRDADDAHLGRLFGVKGDALQAAVDADLGIYRSPLMAAVDRYGPGVMYAAMDFAGLPTGSQRRLLENGVIFSGLFGLLRPDDLIPDYKLKMDAKVGDFGKAAAYWREPLSAELNKLVDGHAVWNLLPASHEAAWDDAGTYGRMIRVKFYKQDEAGERTAVSHGVKELRGSLVAYIVNETADAVGALDLWEPPDGYEVDHEGSEIDEAGGGTVVMVSSPGWETRRAARRKARAQAEAEVAAAKRAREEDDD